MLDALTYMNISIVNELGQYQHIRKSSRDISNSTSLFAVLFSIQTYYMNLIFSPSWSIVVSSHHTVSFTVQKIAISFFKQP